MASLFLFCWFVVALWDNTRLIIDESAEISNISLNEQSAIIG